MQLIRLRGWFDIFKSADTNATDMVSNKILILSVASFSNLYQLDLFRVTCDWVILNNELYGEAYILTQQVEKANFPAFGHMALNRTGKTALKSQKENLGSD